RLAQTVNVEESWSGGHVFSSSQPELAFGVVVQRAPEHPIDDDHIQTHHDDAEHDAMKVARVGFVRDIGAEPGGLQVLVPHGATSATILAFHEPPDAVIAPVT